MSLPFAMGLVQLHSQDGFSWRGNTAREMLDARVSRD